MYQDTVVLHTLKAELEKLDQLRFDLMRKIAKVELLPFIAETLWKHPNGLEKKPLEDIILSNFPLLSRTHITKSLYILSVGGSIYYCASSKQYFLKPVFYKK